MSQIFHPSVNIIARVTLFGSLAIVVAGGWFLDRALRSDYVRGVGVAPDQPIPFSHRHHVGDIGIDCRYCHWPVEEGPVAGIPPVEVCMTCHSQIWSDTPLLAPVRDAASTGRFPAWRRVHATPDHVFFHHAVHVRQGVACVTCHGRVDQMPLVHAARPFLMEDCVSCHRDPAPRLHGRDAVFSTSAPASAADGARLVTRYGIRTPGLDDCSVCHR